MKIGAVANMVYGYNTHKELKKSITDVKSKIVFTLDTFQDKFEQIVDEIQVERIVVSKFIQSMSHISQEDAKLFNETKVLSLPEDSRFIAWEYFFAHKVESVMTCHNSDAPAVITYTGGTTGGSKGAMLSNKVVNAVAVQYIEYSRKVDR